MNCIVCGVKVEDDEQKCLGCRQSNIQVLSAEERLGFKGTTLEQDQNEQGYSGYEKSHANQRIYVKQFSVGNTSLLTKVVIGLILAGIVIVALPIALFIMSVVGLFLYVARK